MPTGPTDAWDFLADKVSVPTELRTAEMEIVPQYLKERAFYMAGVADAEILQEFRERTEDVAAGRLSEEEAFKELRMALSDASYQPPPGAEGTIKDLRTLRRMQVTIRTNIALVRGWMQREQGLRTLRAFPGWELIRAEDRRVPREWAERWDLAEGPANASGRLIALKTDDVWARLGDPALFEDALGVAYPIFAWGSGMGWAPVGFREMQSLGLIPAGWRPPEPGPVASPNASLESSPRVTDEDLRSGLADELQALAEWRGDTLVFTDPNGTRPVTQTELAGVWARPMPKEFATLRGGGHVQREAFERWLQDPAQFDLAGDTNAWHDLLRLAGRIVADAAPELARVWLVPAEAALDLLAKWRAGGFYVSPTWQPLESWMPSALVPAGEASAKWWRIQVVLAEGAAVPRPVGELAAAFGHDSPNLWVVPTGSRFRVVDVVADDARRTAVVRIEEEVRP